MISSRVLTTMMVWKNRVKKNDDRRMEEERHDYDGSGDPMTVQEGDRDDGSGDRTESGQEVYMLVKHVLTS